MPFNGEINKTFGVYKSVCCSYEIVIAEGVEFPDCPKHPKLVTKWKSSVDEEPIPHVNQLPSIKKNNPAA